MRAPLSDFEFLSEGIGCEDADEHATDEGYEEEEEEEEEGEEEEESSRSTPITSVDSWWTILPDSTARRSPLLPRLTAGDMVPLRRSSWITCRLKLMAAVHRVWDCVDPSRFVLLRSLSFAS